MNYIPVNEPSLDGNEKKYLQECIDTGWISSEGPYIKKLENVFCSMVGRNYGIAVANGTAALEIAIKAADIGIGDEVIMPSFTIISCAAAVVKNGAKPVLVDAYSDTWNMDVSQIEKKITKNTKAIMVVHIYGLTVDMDTVITLANKYKLLIIEDAAEAHALKYKDKLCGSFGHISIFSFYPNKLVTTGEGGMILTDNETYAERCKSLRNLCFVPEQRFIHYELGWNYRMSNLQAAVGLAQFEKLEETKFKRIEMGKQYTNLLQHVPNIELPIEKTAYTENGYWVFGIVLKENIDKTAKQLMNELHENGIGTRPFFWGMHEQPVFKNMGLFEGESYPVTERIARRGFYLPSGATITTEQINRVVEVVIKLCK